MPKPIKIISGSGDDKLIYRKIERYLEDLIANNKLKVGDRLLPEQDIGKMFNASNRPVRLAMQKFVKQGIFEKVRSRGTFVKKLPTQAVTGKIGVLYCHSQQGFFQSSFYTTILSGVVEQAQTDRQTLLFRSLVQEGSSSDTITDPAQTFSELEPEVDGFLLVDLTPPLARELEKTIKAIPKPVVILNYGERWETVDSVTTDNDENTEKLVQFLIDLGHRRIAFLYSSHIKTDIASVNVLQRKEAYQQTLRSNNLPVDDQLVGCWNEESGDPVFDRMMQRENPPTAVFCAGIHIARHVVYARAQARGLSIPDDLSVVSYDNTAECTFLYPAVTAIDAPLGEMGRLGIKRLLAIQQERKQGLLRHDHIVLSGKVVERESHRNLNTPAPKLGSPRPAR